MISTADVVIRNLYTPSYKNLNYMYDTKTKVHRETMEMFE